MSDVTIEVRRNGPYKVMGPIRLVDADGEEYDLSEDVVFLCRCGKSKIKPFCDGTHKREGFVADECARTRNEAGR